MIVEFINLMLVKRNLNRFLCMWAYYYNETMTSEGVGVVFQRVRCGLHPGFVYSLSGGLHFLQNFSNQATYVPVMHAFCFCMLCIGCLDI